MMLNLFQFQALLLIFLAMNSKSVMTISPDEELLLIIHKNVPLKIYVLSYLQNIDFYKRDGYFYTVVFFVKNKRIL